MYSKVPLEHTKSKLPWEQISQVMWPRELTEPAVHSVATDAVHSCPAGQSMQVSLPALGWYVPRTVHWLVTQNNNYYWLAVLTTTD